MRAEDFALVARGMAPVVREFVAAAVAGLQGHIATLEQRLVVAEQRAMVPGPGGEDGDDGDVDMVAVQASIEASVAKAVAAIPPPKDGRSVTVAEIADVVSIEVGKALAGWPRPKDGVDGQPGANGKDADVDLDGLALRAAELIPRPKDGANGVDGTDGHSYTVAELAELVSIEVTRSVTALPVPKDGLSVTVDDVRPLVASTVAEAVRALPVAKDGVGLASVLIDRAGHLVLMLTNGETKDVGLVTGKDVDMVAVASLIRDEIATMPRPKDGLDGVDGLGIDDLEVVHDGERTFTLRWSKGERVVEKDFKLPVLIMRGVWQPGRDYEIGDVVIRDNCMWWAKVSTSAQPGGEPSHDKSKQTWVLCTRKGGDGKPGAPGPKGEDGKPGRDGRDLTSMTQDGTKYR